MEKSSYRVNEAEKLYREVKWTKFILSFVLNVVIAIIRTIIGGCKKSTNQSYWDVDDFSFDEDYETPKKVKKVKRLKKNLGKK